MAKPKPVVALLGASGNLGSCLMRRHDRSLLQLLPVSREIDHATGFFLDANREIAHSEGLKPDLIINLANYYTPLESSEDILKMEDAILGTAETLTKFITRYQTPVISASTYLQYAPEDMRPWSRYADLKRQAQERLLDVSVVAASNFADFVLYDNFGGRRRGKFVDELLNSIESGSPLAATPGWQVLNLTHLDDLADGLLRQICMMLSESTSNQKVMELKSSYNRTLRGLVDDINEMLEVSLNVNWGSLPYREKEVFEPWNTGLTAPEWWNPKFGFITWVAALNLNSLQRKPSWEI